MELVRERRGGPSATGASTWWTLPSIQGRRHGTSGPFRPRQAVGLLRCRRRGATRLDRICGRGSHRPSSCRATAATRHLRFLPFGLSANLAVPREVFEAVRGFDEELSPGEDVDLCWRLQLRDTGSRWRPMQSWKRVSVLPDCTRSMPPRTTDGAGRGSTCPVAPKPATRSSGSSKGVDLVGGRFSPARPAPPTMSVGARVCYSFRPPGRFGPPSGVLYPDPAARHLHLHSTSQVVPTWRGVATMTPSGGSMMSGPKASKDTAGFHGSKGVSAHLPKLVIAVQME
jgi:hypothetical protein